MRPPPVAKKGNAAGPVAEIVTEPGPSLMVMFAPAVIVASDGALPVAPIRICPFVAAGVEVTLVGLEK